MVKCFFMSRFICDSGILRRYIGGDPKYVTMVDKIGSSNIVITPVIRIELHRWLSLYKGLTIKQRNLFRKIIEAFPLLYITENVSKIAIEISDKDNSLDAPDILIGATAIYHKIPLLTANKKHFKRMKKGIKII